MGHITLINDLRQSIKTQSLCMQKYILKIYLSINFTIYYIISKQCTIYNGHPIDRSSYC